MPARFSVFQTVLFIGDFLRHQSEKATSKDEFSLKRNALSQYEAKSPKGSSLFFSLSQGFYLLFHNTKTHPSIWLSENFHFLQDAIAYFIRARNSDGSVGGYPFHGALLCPVPTHMAIPLILCSQVHFHLQT